MVRVDEPKFLLWRREATIKQNWLQYIYYVYRNNQEKMSLKILLLVLPNLLCVSSQLEFFGTTPLHVAAKKSDTSSFATALSSHAESVDIVDEDGNTALMWSAWEGHTSHVQALIQAGAQVDLQENDGNTALLKASYNGKDDAVKALLDSGADVDKMNFYKMSPLMMASMVGHTHIVRTLLDAGAKVNARDQGGVSALHKASWMGFDETVKVLIDSGADVNMPRHDGITPYALAESSTVEGRTQEQANKVMKLLEDAGATKPKKEKIEMNDL